MKSQTVVDQFGGARPLPTARINYTVTVQAVGLGSAANAVFSDNIPANTTYVPGTLQSQQQRCSPTSPPMTRANSQRRRAPRVRVTLGTLTQASGTQTIQFAVTIN